jgi:WD40 repeat protein
MTRVFIASQSPTCWTAIHENSDVSCVRISPTDQVIASGCFNGNIYLRSSSDSRLMYRIQAVLRSSPITSIRWHPTAPNSLISSSASGILSCWHIETNQKLWSIEEPTNSINSFDISPHNSHFATVGSDSIVRYYDFATRKKLLELASKIYTQGTVTGHSSHVFAAAFQNQNVIASSGWDDTVLLWDIRNAQMVRSIFGTHVCGEALCFVNQGKIMISGSWREKDQLQFWDVGSGKVMKSVSIGGQGEELQIYSLSVSKDENFVAAAGSGKNCVAFYRIKDYQCLAVTESYEACVNSVHMGIKKFAYGLMNSQLYVDNYGGW